MARAANATCSPKVGIAPITVPTPDTWDLDGMVWTSFIAEGLLAAHAKKDVNLTDLNGIVSSKDPSALLKWVADNMPKLEEGDAL